MHLRFPHHYCRPPFNTRTLGDFCISICNEFNEGSRTYRGRRSPNPGVRGNSDNTLKVLMYPSCPLLPLGQAAIWKPPHGQVFVLFSGFSDKTFYLKKKVCWLNLPRPSLWGEWKEQTALNENISSPLLPLRAGAVREKRCLKRRS